MRLANAAIPAVFNETLPGGDLMLADIVIDGDRIASVTPASGSIIGARDCGGGIVVSGAMAEEKIGNIERTQARLCTGGDASCLLHLGGVMSRRGTTAPDGSPVTTLHFAEILAATRAAGDGGLDHSALHRTVRRLNGESS